MDLSVCLIESYCPATKKYCSLADIKRTKKKCSKDYYPKNCLWACAVYMLSPITRDVKLLSLKIKHPVLKAPSVTPLVGSLLLYFDVAVQTAFAFGAIQNIYIYINALLFVINYVTCEPAC
jgi:hypothetical protein